MTPCSSCARHVRDTETACPFCGVERAPSSPRTVAVIGRVTRAAVFSAALVACGTKHDEPKPAPPAGSAEKLDQDFNQLLGSAEPGSAVAHASDAAVAGDAAQVAVPVDAMSDEERTRQLQHEQQQKTDQHKRDEEQALRRQREEEQRRREDQIRIQQQQNFNQNAKPYGAPPARRRVV